MLNHDFVPVTKALLARVLAGSILISSLGAQSAPLATKPALTGSRSPYRTDRFPKRADLHYGLIWGVDSLNVKSVESGEIIRFTYRVLDPGKAAVLSDKKLEPALIDQKAGVKLVVPSLEKVGQLRQSGTPVAGKAYWMAFSNKGRLVKRGDRVSVVIGKFRAIGLVVD